MDNLALAPLLNSSALRAGVTGEWNVLAVFAYPENSDTLLRVLEGLPVNISFVTTIEEAHELLSSRQIDMAFCGESLPDGSYRRILLESPLAIRSATHFVIALRTEGWDAAIEARRLGAAEVLKCPLRPIDIELALIRAGRERIRQGFDVMA